MLTMRLYLVDGKHDFTHPTAESRNNLSREEFKQNLATLLKAPTRKRREFAGKKKTMTLSGKETEIEQLLKELKTKGKIED